MAIGGVGQRKPPLKGKQKKGDDLFNEHLPRVRHTATLILQGSERLGHLSKVTQQTRDSGSSLGLSDFQFMLSLLCP